MSFVVLGPQASSPARVQRNSEREVNAVDIHHLVAFDAGSEDACGPRTTMLILVFTRD
jgi:hypothetical protein